MEQLFTSGRIIDIILVFVVAEYAGLRIYLGREVARLNLLSFLASGALLLLALRFALVGGSWIWIALCLAGAGAVHAIELRRRLTGLRT